MVWLGGKSAGERVFPAKRGDGGVEYQGQRQAGETRMPHRAHLGMNLISAVRAALLNTTGSHCKVSSLTETGSHIFFHFLIHNRFFFFLQTPKNSLAVLIAKLSKVDN